jgi:predicted Zn-dependent protease
LDPENPYIANLMGYALLRADRPGESVETLRQAVALDPGYAWGYFDLARALCVAGRFDEAATAARKAVQKRPELQATMAGDGEFRRVCEPILGEILPE